MLTHLVILECLFYVLTQKNIVIRDNFRICCQSFRLLQMAAVNMVALIKGFYKLVCWCVFFIFVLSCTCYLCLINPLDPTYFNPARGISP